jgi:hypothetical protein
MIHRRREFERANRKLPYVRIWGSLFSFLARYVSSALPCLLQQHSPSAAQVSAQFDLTVWFHIRIWGSSAPQISVS